MLPSGSQNPMGSSPSMNPSLIRNNSGIMVPGGQVGSMPPQPQYTSMMSQRTQFGNGSNNMSLLGNIPNVSSLLNQSFGNGGQGACSGISAPQINIHQRGIGGALDMVASAEQDQLSFSSGQSQNQQLQNPPATQLGSDHTQAPQPVDAATQSFQQQFAVPHGQQQSLRGVLGNMGPVKLEQPMGGLDQNGSSQQLQTLRNLASVKSEPQQLQPMRSLGMVKLEQHSDPSLFLQQQQQLMQMSRQNSQAAAQMSILQQQRLLQMHQQQQQQQQLLKAALPQQRPQLQQQQQQQQQQLQQQAISLRSLVKPSVYEPGTCARRLTQYMHHQQHRPADNNIEFWRKFVNEYFSPHAKKRWCVSLYGTGKQTTGVFPQDVWHCEICNRKPGRGFETTVEVLPRLLKIKYDSGTLEELLYVDMPQEYQNASGQIVLDYAKAIQESVFEHLRVVRDGQLRIVFSSDLKICSWEFCARRHEELIPRRIIVPQVNQLGTLAQKYQTATQNAASTSGLPSQDLQNTCDSFVASARQLAKALEVPLVNDLGYTKRYVRCLQISEVVNSMKDLIDYSRETGTGPMASLINFPRKTSGFRVLVPQQSEEQQSITQAPHQNDIRTVQTSGLQHVSGGSGAISVNINPSTSIMSASPMLLHQNSTNSRLENSMGNIGSPYGGANPVQIPSTSSSNSLPLSQPNPSSFPSPTPSASNNSNNNNGLQTSNNNQHLATMNASANLMMLHQQQQQQRPPIGSSNDANMNDSQSSVQQIIQEMMSSQFNGINPLGNEAKVINGITPVFNGENCLVGNGITNRSSINNMGYGSIGGMGASPTAAAFRATMANNGMFNGRVGINAMAHDITVNPSMNQQQQQQQEMGNRLLNSGLGNMSNFNNLQFDWKSPH